MAWYYILFFTVFAFFIIKMILTLVLGDTDIDVDFDADGDIDFDLSTVFSFKGVLHFLLGFSSYLSAIAKFKTDFISFNFNDYIVAVSVGILFMYGLFYLYKLMMKLNHYNSENIDINNYMCTILINNGLVDTDTPASDHSGHDHAYSYTVLVNTEVGSRKITLLSQHENLPIGSEHKIYKNVYGIYYI